MGPYEGVNEFGVLFFFLQRKGNQRSETAYTGSTLFQKDLHPKVGNE